MSAQGRPRPSRRQVSRTTTVPAPTGGLNAVNSLAAMPPTDAIVMNNWFPGPSNVSLRNGYTISASGFPTWVESIFCYSSPTGDFRFGVSGTAVYAAPGGAIGAAVVTGLTNARWEYTNIATAGGQFLYAANATDAPLLYDGTTWYKITGVSSPYAITGPTTTTLRNPIVWKNRIWFIQDNTLNAYYLPTASIAGAAAVFPLTAIFKLGGSLQAIMTASLTDGSTFDDYIFFLTSEGELAMYGGMDPAQAGLFVLQGIYRIGKPIGRRCWFKYGADTIVICADGFVSLTKMIAIGRVNQEEAISYKVLNLVNESVQSYSGNFGWQGALHPFGQKVLINVPTTTNSSQFQYVMNTVTNSWCTFSGWNAATIEVQGNNLYFGGANFIALADNGQADNGTNITGLIKTAFNYLGTDSQKFVKLCRPLIQTDGAVTLSLNVNMDFVDIPPINQGSSISASGSPWNTSPWNTSSWGVGSTVQINWLTVYGVGFAMALYISVSAMDISINLQAIDYLFEPGGVL